MATVKLPCPSSTCTFETVELDPAQAERQVNLHVKIDHAAAIATASGGDGQKRPEKFPRPEISIDKSTEDWNEFLVTWEQYKEEYKLEGPGLIRQLYACCSEEMKTSLSRITSGQQFKKTEKELLLLMKQFAVRYQNPMVHVQEFLQQTQNQDEGVRQFLTRLRGVGARCNFSEKCLDCDKDISYADSIIRFKLIAGLADPEIKEDILSLEEKSLDDTVKAIEAKESGKHARQTIGTTAATGKVNVTKQKIVQLPDPITFESYQVHRVYCSNCGKVGHTSQKEDREKNCPAWNQICKACNRKGHFQNVCRMKKKQFVGKAKKVDEDVNADTASVIATPFVAEEAHMMNVDLCFGEIAALRYCMEKVSKEVQQINKVKIPHMLYEQLRWIVSRPQPPPDTRVSVRVDTQSYRDQNIRPPSAFKHRVADFVALADTGCQAVCIGPEHLSKLGLSKCDLMEVEMRLSAANGSGLNIIGALFVNISGESSLGEFFQTKQLCYVADGVDKMLLSRGACEKLGIINKVPCRWFC